MKNKTNNIGNDSQIVFTVKTFFALIASILAIFFAFYQLVIIPRVESINDHYEQMYRDQQQQNRIFYEEISKLNGSVGALNTSITSLSERFNDLNKSLSMQSNRNTSGSFNSSTTNHLTHVNDSTLAQN